MKSNVIKNKKDIQSIKDYLKKTNYRDYVLFTLGINTGLKLKDLLMLKFNDVFDENYVFREIKVDNQTICLHKNIQQILIHYKELIGDQYDKTYYIFASRKGKEPIDRSHVYRILNNCAKELNIHVNLGTQSMRKTFGYHFYREGGDIKILRDKLGHPSCQATLKYLEIQRDTFDIQNFYL